MTQHETYDYTPDQEAAYDRLVEHDGFSPDDARRMLGIVATPDVFHDTEALDVHTVTFSERAMTAPDAAEHHAAVARHGRPDDMPDDPHFGPYIR